MSQKKVIRLFEAVVVLVQLAFRALVFCIQHGDTIIRFFYSYMGYMANESIGSIFVGQLFDYSPFASCQNDHTYASVGYEYRFHQL